MFLYICFYILLAIFALDTPVSFQHTDYERQAKKLSEMKVVLISPIGKSAHLQFILLRQEAVASTKASVKFKKLCL